jgi:methylphosphotriester-DNA--protein-cysteine methyltransferase
MATVLQLRRGTTTQHSTFTGALGEVTVDTTKDTVVVHDGSTAGGFALAKESAISSLIDLTDLSVTDSGGDGSLTYDNTTGTFTYTGPSASEVRAHFSASTGISITNGAISSTITQYTDALARAAVSVTDSGGDGSLAYNNTTGVITYTGPSATEVRAHFSAGTGITITSGQVAVDTSTIATKSYADSAATSAVAAVIDSAPAALDTLNELAAALGDDANFSTTTATALGNRLRVDVSNQGLNSTQQGNALTNLGITATLTELNHIDGVTSAIQTQLNAKLASADFNSTFDTRLGTKSTTNLSEGTNLYYTDARARAAISVTDSGGDGSLSYNNATGVITYTGPSASDVRAHFSASTGITITNGAIATTITQYTDALARAAISVTDAGGEGSLAYNNTTGVITYTGPSAANILDALKTVDGTGSGLDADLLDGNSSAHYRINVYDAAGNLLN